MTTSSHATLPALAKLPWHPSNDFTPIASIYVYMLVLTTNAASASHFRTFAEFLTYAKANPGKISWGSSGIAGPQHLAGAQFAKVAGVDMVHVPYRGNGPMLQALLQNDVQLTFDTPTLVTPHIQDGKLIALAVTGEQRLEKLPERADGARDRPGRFLQPGPDFRARHQGHAGAGAGLSEQGVRRDARRPRRSTTGWSASASTVPKSSDNTVADLKKHIDDFAATYGKLIAEHGHQGGVDEIETAGRKPGRCEASTRVGYSTLAPENSTTFFHFAVSDTMILPKSSGVPPIGAPPRSAIFCLHLRIGQRLFDVLVEDRR